MSRTDARRLAAANDHYQRRLAYISSTPAPDTGEHTTFSNRDTGGRGVSRHEVTVCKRCAGPLYVDHGIFGRWLRPEGYVLNGMVHKGTCDGAPA